MRVGLSTILFLSFAFGALAQQKTKAMVAGIDYVPGKVRVKIRPSFKVDFARHADAKIRSLSASSISPLISKKLARKGAAWRGPVNATPKVDVEQYFEIVFDRSENISSAIDRFNRSGFFEIVEPAYIAHTSFTPNDPSVSNQYYLKNIKAFEAWDITHGSEGVTIAIIDTGGDLPHPDLSGNLYINTKEIPNNGIDDDDDGYVDNYRGWDFVGADTLNAYKDNFAGDNDPSIHSGGSNSHGTQVAGCASASTNNSIGISGVGYQTKLMFTKQSGDNQKTTEGTIYDGYSGVLYAANQGIKIINCSWGSTFSSQIEQDIINHVTLDLGCLVVAAAGNTASQALYPGAYDNVLAAGATDQNDAITAFSFRGATVDIFAPGSNIYSTSFSSAYASVTGTSFSSPVTSGAAALIMSVHPDYTPGQVTELLRTTADVLSSYTAGGRVYMVNRLNIQKALQYNSPLLEASNFKILNAAGNPAQPGDIGSLSMDITNLLQPTTSNLNISVSATYGPGVINFINNSIAPGPIAANKTIDTRAFPLQFTDDAPPNTTINVTLTYSDINYQSSQSFTLVINKPPLFEININQVTTSVGSAGTIGFEPTGSGQRGDGFLFMQRQLVSEIGVIIGTDDSTIYSNVRGVDPFTPDNDFYPTVEIQKIIPGIRSDEEIFGQFSNSVVPSEQSVLVDYRSLTWESSPADKFIIMEYKIENPTSKTLNNLYFGLFADWDISPSNDFADWYAAENTGYIFPAGEFPGPFAGTQLLTGISSYYAIDNNLTTEGMSDNAPFAINDGFTDAEKYVTLSSRRLTAGMSLTDGADVSHVVSSGPHQIKPGQSIIVAFALHAAQNLNDLRSSARTADSIYNHKIPEIDPSTFSIFPNPVQNDPLTVKVNDVSGTVVNITVLNLMGRSVLTDQFQTSDRIDQAEVPMQDLPAGVYIVRITAGAQTILAKIVKAP